MAIHLFNPDTDQALAHHGAHYLPSKSIIQLMDDLALLPLWYAPAGSALLVPRATTVAALPPALQTFAAQDITLLTWDQLAAANGHRIIPWGWNLALRHRLLQSGVDESLLPTAQQIETLRQLSSRHTIAPLLHAFAGRPQFVGQVQCLTTLEQCRSYVDGRPSLLKLPWSSSGKGLNWCRHGFTPLIQSWCAKALRTQGSIQAAPIYHKVFDFAMEFHLVAPGQCRFIGYSRFTTNDSGAYQGNLLASDSRIEREIHTYLPAGTLSLTRQLLLPALTELSHRYQGPLGIDMMVCLEEGTYRLHPCVEMNLRLNMGIVAHTIHRRHLHPDACGHFRLHHFSTPQALQAEVARLAALHPLQLDEGRILHGFMPLVPITPQTQNLAYLLVE